MKMKIYKGLDFLLYSNIFISICAAAITAETYLLIRSEINWLYISFVFFSTLVLYDFSNLFLGKVAFSVNQSLRHKWIIANKNALMILSMISIIMIAIVASSFKLKFILLFIPIVVLAFSYFFPQTRLRSITGVKDTIVAFVWTMTTSGYPLLLASMSTVKSGDLFTKENGLFIIERFLFILPIGAIFNVRDIETDRNSGVRTIPVVYGVRATVITCLILLLLFSILVFFNSRFSLETIALIASAIVTGILTIKSSPDKNDYFYFLWIDGMVLLQVGFVFFQDLF